MWVPCAVGAVLRLSHRRGGAICRGRIWLAVVDCEASRGFRVAQWVEDEPVAEVSSTVGRCADALDQRSVSPNFAFFDREDVADPRWWIEVRRHRPGPKAEVTELGHVLP